MEVLDFLLFRYSCMVEHWKNLEPSDFLKKVSYYTALKLLENLVPNFLMLNSATGETL